MTIKQKPKLYQENTLTGEVLWIGSSGLLYESDAMMGATRITSGLEDEKYAYVVMKVKIDDN